MPIWLPWLGPNWIFIFPRSDQSWNNWHSVSLVLGPGGLCSLFTSKLYRQDGVFFVSKRGESLSPFLNPKLGRICVPGVGWPRDYFKPRYLKMIEGVTINNHIRTASRNQAILGKLTHFLSFSWTDVQSSFSYLIRDTERIGSPAYSVTKRRRQVFIGDVQM